MSDGRRPVTRDAKCASGISLMASFAGHDESEICGRWYDSMLLERVPIEPNRKVLGDGSAQLCHLVTCVGQFDVSFALANKPKIMEVFNALCDDIATQVGL